MSALLFFIKNKILFLVILPYIYFIFKILIQTQTQTNQ